MIANSKSPLARNRVLCLRCKTVAESRYADERVSCTCGKASVDGGRVFPRRYGHVFDWIDISEDENGELICLPTYLDCEASSLHRDSYPIEIAMNDANGQIDSRLINPYSVEGWDDWSMGAQYEAHNLSREELRTKGQPAEVVASWLAQALGAREGVVWSDAPEFDGFWLSRLMSVTQDIRSNSRSGDGTERHNAMRVMDANLIWHSLCEEPRHILDDFKDAARRMAGPAHRAEQDVKYLMELHRLLFVHCLQPTLD